MSILELDQVSVTYDGERNAVDHVSMQVEQGEIIGIVGESGSGKSTLLHGILGLLPRDAASKGSIRVFGRELSSMTPSELRKLRGEGIAMIFQDTGSYMNPISRIGKQYTGYLRLHRNMSKEDCRKLELDFLERVHLHDPERILHSYPFELSGGMRQRVGIAMAMSLEPKILLADEPTSALDVTVQAQVIRQMKELRRKYGTTIIMVTHNMGVAAYLSDRIGVMQNGRLLELSPAEDLVNHPETVYTKALLSSVIELDDERLAGRSADSFSGTGKAFSEGTLI